MEHSSLRKATFFPVTSPDPCFILPYREEPHAYVWDSPAACLSPGHTASTQPPLAANYHTLDTPLV